MQERNIDAANVADNQSNPLPVPPPYSIGLTEPPNNQNLIYLLHLLLVVLRLVIKESICYLKGRPHPDQTVILRAVINLFREGLPDEEPTPTVTLRPTINRVVLRSDSDQEEAFDVEQFSDSWFEEEDTSRVPEPPAGWDQEGNPLNQEEVDALLSSEA